MKFERWYVFILILIVLIMNIPIHVSCYDIHVTYDQWRTDMIKGIHYEDTLIFSPRDKFEFGEKDTFYFIQNNEKIQNASYQYIRFNTVGKNSFWEKNDYNDRFTTLSFHGYENESTQIIIQNKENLLSNIDLCLTSNLSFSSGSFFGYSFIANESTLSIIDLNISFFFNEWYKILYDPTTKTIFQYHYDPYNLSSYNEYTLKESRIFEITILQQINGISIIIDNFKYTSNETVDFNVFSYHEWYPPEFLGVNTSYGIISVTLHFPNVYKINPTISKELPSSVLFISYRSPFNSSSPSYAFYIAELLSNKKIYLYSQDGVTWIPIGIENEKNITLKISYSNDDTLNYIEIGDFKTHNKGIRYYRLFGSFEIAHEGYSNTSYYIDFSFVTDGILPSIEYTIEYSDQNIVTGYGWIRVRANYTLESISGIFSADGLYSSYMNNGEAFMKIYSDMNEINKDFVILLYSLDGTLFLRKVITIKTLYISNNNDPSIPVTKDIIFIITIIVSSIAGIGIIKKRKKNKKIIIEKNERNMKTFYPGIGEITEKCIVQDGSLICEKDFNRQF